MTPDERTAVEEMAREHGQRSAEIAVGFFNRMDEKFATRDALALTIAFLNGPLCRPYSVTTTTVDGDGTMQTIAVNAS